MYEEYERSLWNWRPKRQKKNQQQQKPHKMFQQISPEVTSEIMHSSKLIHQVLQLASSSTKWHSWKGDCLTSMEPKRRPTLKPEHQQTKAYCWAIQLLKQPNHWRRVGNVNRGFLSQENLWNSGVFFSPKKLKRKFIFVCSLPRSG